jgi:hypothetical protein
LILGNEGAWDNRVSQPHCWSQRGSRFEFPGLGTGNKRELACEADVTFDADADGGIERRGAALLDREHVPIWGDEASAFEDLVEKSHWLCAAAYRQHVRGRTDLLESG